MAKINITKWAKWIGYAGFFLSPPIGIWYVQAGMKRMEKGVHDDLERIRMKGKTVGDIPRKE
jgi:hypothetical protein